MTNSVAETTAQPLAQTNSKKNLFSLEPKTLEEAMNYAKLISQSELVPKDFRGKPENVLIAVQMGMEVGLPPTQALQNIAVINGRPAMWGDAVLALAKASSLCEYVNEEIHEDKAICRVKRRGEPETVREFTMEDAKRAGLAGKQGPWREYPKRMLQMRARSWAIRDVFPDLLKGIHVVEEAQDIPSVKDITPNQPSGETRTEQLKDKLKGRKTETIEGKAEAEPDPAPDSDKFDEFLRKIALAADEDQLAVAAKDAKTLGPDDQHAARKAYRLRLAQLRKEPISEVDGRLINNETGEEVAIK